MKKFLLPLFILFVLNSFAQNRYWETNYPFNASGYTNWSGVANDYIAIPDPDSSLTVTGLKNLIANTPDMIGAWSVPYGGRYAIKLNSNNELEIQFNSGMDEWSGISLNFFEQTWIAQSLPFSSNPYKGYLVDMQPTSTGYNNATVSAEIFVPSELQNLTTTKGFPVKIALFDIHGHEINAGMETDDTVKIGEYDKWTPISIDLNNFSSTYGNLTANPGDKWTTQFFNVNRPIPSASDLNMIPIDFSKIAGIRIYLALGQLDQTPITTVKMRNLVVGASINASELIFDNLITRTLNVIQNELVFEGITDIDYSSMYFSDADDLTFEISTLTSGFDFTISGNTFSFSSSNYCDALVPASIKISSIQAKKEITLTVFVKNPNELLSFSLSDIPNQISSGTNPFPVLNLKNYFTDPCSSGLYSATVSGGNYVNLAFDNDLMGTVTISEARWMGIENLNITLKRDNIVVGELPVKYIKTLPQDVSATTPPSVIINPSKIVVAENEVISFSPSLIRATDVHWQFEGANITDSYDLNPSISFPNAGTYTVSLTGINSVTQTPSTVNITVVGITGGKNVICLNENLHLSASIDNANYLWSNGSTNQSITVSPTSPITYSVTITKDALTYNDEISVTEIKVPYKEELGIATVSDDNKSVILAWERTDGKGTQSYLILREGSVTNKFDTISTVEFNNVSIYNDTQADVMRRSYKYAIVTVDECGNRSEKSTVHTTMHLSITKDIYGNAALSWNEYVPEDIYSTIGVYRVVNGQSVLMENISGTSTSFTDDQFVEGTVYRTAVILNDTISPATLKSTSGPFSQSMSNLSEAELTSTGDVKFEGNVVVFPNPNNGNFSIAITSDREQTFEIEVATESGSVVCKKTFSCMTQVLDKVSNLNSGIYILTVDNGYSKISKKILVN